MGIPGVAALRSIDPADTDYSDLAPIAAAIGDAQVVLLGEPSHSDGAAFDAKARIVRFLHAQHGFDVLAWECGTFEMGLMDALLSQGANAREAMGQLFAVWHCTSVLDLLEQTRSTEGRGPLHHVGLDCQISRPQSALLLAQLVISAADAQGLELTDEEAELLVEAATALGEAPGEGEKLGVDPAIQLLARIHEVITDPLTSRLVANLAVALELQKLARQLDLKPPFTEVSPQTRSVLRQINRVRDAAMGQNLIWLATELLPGRRIVGWLATAHAAAKLRRMKPSTEAFVESWTLADEARGVLPEGSVYSIGLTALSAAPDGLEGLVREAGYEHAFADLRTLAPDHPFRGSQQARLLGHTPFENDWSASVDGVVFVRDSYQPNRSF